MAMKGLLDRIGFEFQVNWHSNGQWLLYAEGWQIAHAHGGRPDLLRPVRQPRPAGDQGLPPGPQLRRPVRHQRRDHRLCARRHRRAGMDARAVGGLRRLRVRVPRRRGARAGGVRAQPAVRAVGRASRRTILTTRCPCSASRRSRSIRRATTRTRTASRASTSSSPTRTAIRSRSRCWPSAASGAVTLKYRINGGAVQSAPTSEWGGGERFKPAAVYYHEMRGVVTGTSPGDAVEVWFEGGGERSDSFTYRAVSETGRRVLVVAAEDYTGPSPVQTPAAALPAVLPERAPGQRGHGRRVRRRRPRPHGAGPPRRARATTTP